MNYLNLLRNLNDTNVYETLLNVTRGSIGKKLDQSRLILKEKEIKKLGGAWAGLTEGLNHPSLAIGTNSRKSSSITGVVVSDSAKGAVKKYALQVEEKPNGSIFQLKEQTLNSEGKMETTCDKLVDMSDPMLNMFIKSENQTIKSQTKKIRSNVTKNAKAMKESATQKEMTETVAPMLKQENITQEVTQAQKNKRATKKQQIANAEVKEQGKIIAKSAKPVLKFEPIENLNLEQIEDEIKVLGEHLKKQEKELWDEIFPLQIGKQPVFTLNDLYTYSARDHYHPHYGNTISVNDKILRLRQECLDMRSRLYQLSFARTQNPSKDDMWKFIGDYNYYDVSNWSSRIKCIELLPKDKQIDAAVKMFAKDIQIPAEHIKIKKLPYKEGTLQGAAFKPEQGIIYTYFPSSVNPATQIALIRHEMDHMELFVKLCKSMGMDDFIQMLKKKNPNLNEKLVRKQYEKLIETVDVKDFDAQKYIKSFQDYDMLGQSSRNYVGNSIESRAYRLQAQYDYNDPVTRSNAITFSIYTEGNEMLDAISKKIGREFTESDFNSLVGDSLLQMIVNPASPFIRQELAEKATKLMKQILLNLDNGIPMEKTVEMFKSGMRSI